jgi:hypothetical protein
VAGRDLQIQRVIDCLATGGFSLKYVAKSGAPPPDKATADGETMSCLGLSWDPAEDTLSIEIDPLVIKKRVKGIRGVHGYQKEGQRNKRGTSTSNQKRN